MKYVINIVDNGKIHYIEKTANKYAPVNITNSMQFAAVFNTAQEAMSFYTKYIQEIETIIDNNKAKVYIESVRLVSDDNKVEIPNLFDIL